MACVNAFPLKHGDPDPIASESVICARDFLNAVDNLNNTDAGINCHWKGRVTTKWCRAYTKAHGDTNQMKNIIDDDDIGLASMLRDHMKTSVNAAKRWTTSSVFLEDRVFVKPTRKFSVISLEAGGGDACVPVRHAPNWARRMEEEVGKSSVQLVDLFNEHDGETGFDEFAESLKVVSTAMKLPGSA